MKERIGSNTNKEEYQNHFYLSDYKINKAYAADGHRSPPPPPLLIDIDLRFDSFSSLSSLYYTTATAFALQTETLAIVRFSITSVCVY